MRLDIKINGKEIFVKCKIEVDKDICSFALCESLNINRIKNNNVDASPVSVEICELQFRPRMKKYYFNNLENGLLTFEYYGNINGSFLYMQEEIYHFSFYNGWYPIGFDVKEEFEVTIDINDTYELINGFYDSEHMLWKYNTKHQKLLKDCNILLINKEKSFKYTNNNFDLYYFNSKYEQYTKKFFERYISIYNYYVNFYEEDMIQKTTIVFLPEKYKLGGYRRDNLIVFSELSEDIDEEMHRLAHEMAHSYACGADTNKWEDWLNETHAEWSALLYEFENNENLFRKLIKNIISMEDSNILLKPNGMERPDDVHKVGTILYYNIYKKYGINRIKLLLKTFHHLKDKNTSSFLSELSKKDKELTKIIESKI